MLTDRSKSLIEKMKHEIEVADNRANGSLRFKDFKKLDIEVTSKELAATMQTVQRLREFLSRDESQLAIDRIQHIEDKTKDVQHQTIAVKKEAAFLRAKLGKLSDENASIVNLSSNLIRDSTHYSASSVSSRLIKTTPFNL